jgi:DedD protein
MAFFKIRKSVDASGTASHPPQTLEGIRLRAIFRLIGSAVLVAAAIVGFPLVFDSQPRPIAVDISIDIPDKTKVSPLAVAKPLPVPVPLATAGPVSIEEKTPEGEAKAATPSLAQVAVVQPDSESKIPAKIEPKGQPKIEQQLEAKPVAKPLSKQDDGAKVLALLEGKGSDLASGSRFVVQVGAFAEATRAKDARIKLESAGLKTYTQVVETKDGQRTRVRVGPFTDKSEAEKVAAKIKVLGLSASVLSL